jgi:hypothetical protein
MSYSRRISTTVPCHYSGSKTVSYPASEHGGSITVNYSGTAYEEVDVDIHVDTSSFDNSVEDCNNHVNGLTASVGAMNAAQCVAIEQNADKVSETIINGFFHTVRTDLSTQRAELEQAIEARLILLRQQAESLREKQKIMEEDYARTTARYQKLFADLNNELSVRIHQVDQPVFSLVKDVDTQSDRMLHTDMVQTAVTMSKESSLLQAQISAATVKHHALEAMNQAQNFLVSKAMTERTIQDTCVEGSGEDSYLIPVCYMRTESENKHINRECFLPDYLSKQDESLQQKICESMEDIDLESSDGNNDDQIKSYVQSEIATNIVGNDDHSSRVRAMINKLLNK